MENSLRVDERWVPAIGYEGYYEISNYGTVRSLDRVVPVRNHPRQSQKVLLGEIKTPGRDGHGYPKIELSKNGITKSYCIHVLVAHHFIDGYKPGLEVRHRDGNKDNCYFKNLKWGTSKENRQDVIKHGNDHNLNKVICPLGHALKSPNLRPSSNGHRRCLTCKRTQDALKNNSRLRELGIKTVSEVYYSMIMSGELPRYFKIEEYLINKGVL